jgi:hypothetical protein
MMASAMTQPDPRPDPDVVDFMLDYCKSAPLDQVDASKNVDSKAVQVFAGASIVVGLAAAGRLHGNSVYLVAAAVAVYALVVGLALLILRPRDLSVASSAPALWAHRHRGLGALKRALMRRQNEDYSENEKVLRAKNRLLRFALLAAGAETALIAAALIVSLV